MPAFRNIRPARRSLSLNRDQDDFEQPSTDFVANSSISSRTIYTSRLNIRDSTAGSSPVAKRPRLILHGPKRYANSEQSKSIPPLATPALYRASLDPVLASDPKRRCMSTSSYTSNPPRLDLLEPTALHVTPIGQSALLKAPRLKKRDKDHIPRPKNPFILFRSEFYQKFTQAVNEESLKSLDQANLSQQAASKWNSLSEEEKKPYVLWAVEEKKAHAALYPGYSYSPDKKKSKSPRKTSKTLIRKAQNDKDGVVGPPPSLPPLGSRPQSPLTSASSSPISSSLHSASWGRQDDRESGSRMNPITESSPYMILSNEEVLKSTGVTKLGVTGERAIHRLQVTSNNPIHLSRGPTVSQSQKRRSTDNPNASHLSTTATMAPNAISAPRMIRPPFSLTTEAPELTNLSQQSLWSSDVYFPVPSDLANSQFTNSPKTLTSGGTPGSLGSVQILETGIIGSSIALGAESAASLVPHQVDDNPFTETLSSIMEEMGEQGLDNAFYLEYERKLAMSSFCMLEKFPVIPPTIPHDRRTNKHTIPPPHVIPEDLPPSLLTTTPHRCNYDPLVGKPLTVPHTMSDLERKRSFSISCLRIESEGPPTAHLTILEDERKRRFSTSRFRAMSEELPSITPAATSHEHRRSFGVGPSATTPTMSIFERKRRLSLFQRTSRFLSSRLYRPNGSAISHRHRLPGSELSHVTFYASKGTELGLAVAPSPPPFPPLQFTAGNVPKAFSVRILGLNFMTC